MVAGGKSATQAYIEAGFSKTGAEQSACRLLKNPEVAERVRDIQAEIGAKLTKAAIRDIDERIREYQSRWDKMRQVIEERAGAPENQTIAGGRTGLLVRTVKSIRDGEASTVVEEFAVDTALLRELRELELLVSKELGQFIERHEHGGGIVERLNAARERLRSLDDKG